MLHTYGTFVRMYMVKYLRVLKGYICMHAYANTFSSEGIHLYACTWSYICVLRGSLSFKQRSRHFRSCGCGAVSVTASDLQSQGRARISKWSEFVAVECDSKLFAVAEQGQDIKRFRVLRCECDSKWFAVTEQGQDIQMIRVWPFPEKTSPAGSTSSRPAGVIPFILRLTILSTWVYDSFHSWAQHPHDPQIWSLTFVAGCAWECSQDHIHHQCTSLGPRDGLLFHFCFSVYSRLEWSGENHNPKKAYIEMMIRNVENFAKEHESEKKQKSFKRNQ